MSRRHGGEESREVPRERVTLMVQELFDGRKVGASELRSASHIGLVIFMFQLAARPEALMITQLMRMELH